MHQTTDRKKKRKRMTIKDEKDEDDFRPARRINYERRWLLHYLIVVLFCLALGPAYAQSQQCAVGLKTPGHTWPSGDIVLEYNDLLSILCVLNATYVNAMFPGKNSSDLEFFEGQNMIPSEYVTIINETAIRLDVDKPKPMNSMLYCKLKLDKDSEKKYEAVCLNKVVVGFKPTEPKNFNCLSQNWENMTCTWDPPQNYVDTIYTISFKLSGRAGGRKMHNCPSDLELRKEKPRNSCFWDSTTHPIYRQPYDIYTFTLNGVNVLGNWSGQYTFKHFANVIPARPTNLTVVNKTLESALLYWSVSFPMQNFPPGLHHRVAYQNQWDSRDTWQIINITNDPHLSRRYFNLTDLKYANTIYDIRVMIKSAVAADDKWSNFSGVAFRTPPRIPGQSPLTDIGSFEIQENNLNRDIYLYWQTIPAYHENGDDFRYQVVYVEENGKRLFTHPNETTRTYAKFRGLGHHNNYKFEIVTSNEVGVLEKPARIYVPGRGSMPKEPVAFTKIAFDDGLYELSWKPPLSGSSEITNYTIFWCDNDRDRPYQCQGYLEWVHVPKTTFVHNITVPDPKKVYQFAIAANTERASSGMVWASCTVIHNKVVGKMKTVWINHIGSTVIEVGWKLDCSDRIGIVDGFKIYYCPIVSPYNLTCRGPKLNTTIKADLSSIRGEVRGLKPYTTYMIAVAVLTKNGEGQHSDPLYNTTLESKPSDSPRDVAVSNVTNTTMHVEWREPLAMNGVLRYYVVYYDSYEKKVEEVTHVDLQGLRAHRNYTIRVSACTVECSAKSQPVYTLTDIGVPDSPRPPTVRFVNSSRVRVFWNKPQQPAGGLDYYQIKSYSGDIMNITSTEAMISIPDCKTVGKERFYRFYVRAVNIGPNNEHLFGNWSDAGEGNCFNSGPSYSVWVLIWVIGSICGIAFVFCVAYSSKRVWVKCKAMQDVDVKLPPGLASNMALLQKGDQHTRQSSADSSGCSSGQESVTSSLTSDSQVSNDSGAEVDPPLKKLVDTIVDSTTTTTASSPATWESTSLRQRNVSGGSKPASLDATRWPEPYVKVGKGSSESPYSQPADSLSLARSTPNLSDDVNFATSQQAWSSAGYLSMPSTEDMSSNPNTVPKDNPNQGSYSVVGTLTKPPTTKTNESETKPYVSLVSMEQKTKGNGVPKALNSLRVFNELSFDNSKQLQPQQSDKQLSRPYVQSSFLDFKKPALPFDSAHNKLPSLTTTVQQQQQQPSFFAQTSLAEELTSKLTAPMSSDTKPYVAISAIPDMIIRKKPEILMPSTSTTTTSHKPYVAVSQLPSTTSMMTTGAAKTTELESCKENETRTPSVNNSAFKSPSAIETLVSNTDECQEKVGNLYPSLDLEVTDETSLSSSRSSTPASPFNVWNPNSESLSTKSFTEVPQSSQQQQQQQHQQPPPQQLQKSSTGYVMLPEQKLLPAQRFVKSPQTTSIQKQQQQQQSSADEQSYSKVAVAPHTLN